MSDRSTAVLDRDVREAEDRERLIAVRELARCRTMRLHYC